MPLGFVPTRLRKVLALGKQPPVLNRLALRTGSFILRNGPLQSQMNGTHCGSLAGLYQHANSTRLQSICLVQIHLNAGREVAQCCGQISDLLGCSQQERLDFRITQILQNPVALQIQIALQQQSDVVWCFNMDVKRSRLCRRFTRLRWAGQQGLR